MKGQCKLRFGFGILVSATTLFLLTTAPIPLLQGQSIARPPQQDRERSDRASVLKKMDSERAKQASARRDIHTKLGENAQQLAAALAQAGARSLLLERFRASKDREQMMELEGFLVAASQRTDIPPAAKINDLLAATRKTKSQIGAAKVRSGFAAKNVDLYFPVPQHQKNWQGNDDLIVAAPPLEESDAVPIIAYSVRTGQPVTLDPKTPPATPVLVVAACEHEDHAKKVERKAEGAPPPPFEIKSPDGQLFDNEKVTLTRGKYPGNSTVYGFYTGMKDDHEPWTSGSAEIFVVYVQYCGGNQATRCNVYFVDDTYHSYYTKNYEIFPFNSSCSDHTYTTIWESDGGSNVWHSVGLMTSPTSYSPNLGYYVQSGDDFIEDRYWFKSSIPYESVSSIGMGYYGWVTMLKSTL
jgi:hypothetical protein